MGRVAPPYGTNMKSSVLYIALLLIALMNAGDVSACTSAIIGAELNPSGRPILWKHRDTSRIDNKVEYIAPSSIGYGYVALFNSDDRKLEEAWIGMNEVGFAVMNTASYNIKDDKVPEKKMDKEGFIMTKALRTCRTVDDFARLLEKYPRPMGVEANFGVIDATGNGAYFETNNHSYKRYDLKDAPGHLMVRTNYSHSGRPGEGYGHVREANTENLLQPYAEEGTITPEILTEVVSRSFYQDAYKRDCSYDEKEILDQDFIPRYKSTATVAIEGCRPVEDTDCIGSDFVSKEYIMWTGLGYPPVSEIRAVRCEPGGVDEELRGTVPGGTSPLADEAKRKRDEIFTVSGKNVYVDVSKLYNSEGTGYVQTLRPMNHDVYIRESGKRDAGE